MHHHHTGLTLRTGVSFCIENDRLIFLDQIGDRYLTLNEAQHQLFAKISAGTPIDVAECNPLDQLIAEGLLIRTPQATSLLPCRGQPPSQAIAPSLQSAVSALTQLRFAWRIAVARRRLKHQGLYKSLETLRLFRTSKGFQTRPSAPALREAADLSVLIGRYITRLDQCLPISLGLAHHLLRKGVDCQLVMGIQLGPFRAHCWVQHGDHLVGDDLDIVRTFTPILVV